MNSNLPTACCPVCFLSSLWCSILETSCWKMWLLADQVQNDNVRVYGLCFIYIRIFWYCICIDFYHCYELLQPIIYYQLWSLFLYPLPAFCRCSLWKTSLQCVEYDCLPHLLMLTHHSLSLLSSLWRFRASEYSLRWIIILPLTTACWLAAFWLPSDAHFYF